MEELYLLRVVKGRPAQKKGLAYSQPELGPWLAFEIHWHSAGEPVYPWAAEVDDERWQIRLNDFLDEIMYPLMINGEPRGDFHDWLETWSR